MRFTGRAARRVGQEIDFVPVCQGREHGHLQADFRPEAGYHQLLPAGLLDPVHDPLVLPAIERGAVDRNLLGENVLDLLDEILTFGEGRGQQRRHLEDICRLGDRGHVSDDLGSLVRAQRQKLKILVVNQEQGVVAGLEEIVRAHLSCPFNLAYSPKLDQFSMHCGFEMLLRRPCAASTAAAFNARATPSP